MVDSVLSEFPHLEDFPKSLATAQAGLESGWGNSYAAKNRNNLFGLTDGRGSLRSFETVEDSVRAYFRTLAKHAAYSDFREKLGKVPVYELTHELGNYSETPDYPNRLNALIRHLGLRHLDAAKGSDANPS